MSKLTLFTLAMAVYYIVVVVLVSKFVLIPIMKVMLFIFFLGAGFLFARKMRKKLQ
ncbi:hypothetical protein MHB42_08595 [Lysinibacillus sp. FSL K6-0232]|uniref:hypothetical protein n=1 Tax=unclassified Lysinibacillus TaxID=2636778 RepID=UPI0030FC3248